MTITRQSILRWLAAYSSFVAVSLSLLYYFGSHQQWGVIEIVKGFVLFPPMHEVPACSLWPSCWETNILQMIPLIFVSAAIYTWPLIFVDVKRLTSIFIAIQFILPFIGFWVTCSFSGRSCGLEVLILPLVYVALFVFVLLWFFLSARKAKGFFGGLLSGIVLSIGMVILSWILDIPF